MSCRREPFGSRAQYIPVMDVRARIDNHLPHRREPVRHPLGRAASLSRVEAEAALAAAVRAYDRGRGKWPTMSVAERIACTQRFIAAMRVAREPSVRLLMWEI